MAKPSWGCGGPRGRARRGRALALVHAGGIERGGGGGAVNGETGVGAGSSSSCKGEAEEASRAAVAGSRAPASGAQGRRGPGRPDLAGNGLGRGSGKLRLWFADGKRKQGRDVRGRREKRERKERAVRGSSEGGSRRRRELRWLCGTCGRTGRGKGDPMVSPATRGRSEQREGAPGVGI